MSMQVAQHLGKAWKDSRHVRNFRGNIENLRKCIIENLGGKNMSGEKIIFVRCNTLENMMRIYFFRQFQTGIISRQLFVQYYYFAYSQKFGNIDITLYLLKVLHPVDNLLLQHTISSSQDSGDQTQYNHHQQCLLQTNRYLLLVVVLQKVVSEFIRLCFINFSEKIKIF